MLRFIIFIIIFCTFNFNILKSQIIPNDTLNNLKEVSTGEAVAELLDLQKCIDIAMTNSKVILDNDLANKIDINNVNQQILSQIYPSISANLALNYVPFIPTSPIPAVAGIGFGQNSKSGSDVIALTFGTEFSGSLNIRLEQQIINTNVIFYTDLKNTYNKLIEVNRKKSREDVLMDVYRSYYALLMVLEQKEFLNSMLLNLDTILTQTQESYEKGFIDKITLNNLKLNRNTIKSQYENIIQISEISYLVLKNSIGYNLDAKILVTEKISDITYEDDFIELINIENIYYSNRTDYKTLEISKKLYDIEKKSEIANMLPSISFVGQFIGNMGATTFANMFNLDNNWFPGLTMGLNMKIPILNNSLTIMRFQKAKLNLHKTINQISMLENGVNLEIKKNKQELININNKINLSKENESIAKEIYDDNDYKYKRGLASYSELLNSYITLNQNKTEKINNIFNFIIKKIELKKALGILK